MTKDKKFQMRCDQEFLDELDWLSKESGLSRSGSTELAVKQYRYVAALVKQHHELIKQLKDQL